MQNLNIFQSVRNFFSKENKHTDISDCKMNAKYNIGDKVYYTSIIGDTTLMTIISIKDNNYELENNTNKEISYVNINSDNLSNTIIAPKQVRFDDTNQINSLLEQNRNTETKYKVGDRISFDHNNCRFLSDIKEVKIVNGQISYLIVPCGYIDSHQKWISEDDHRLSVAHFNDTWNQERINRDFERRLDKEMKNKHKCMCDPNYECVCSLIDVNHSSQPLIPNNIYVSSYQKTNQSSFGSFGSGLRGLSYRKQTKVPVQEPNNTNLYDPESPKFSGSSQSVPPILSSTENKDDILSEEKNNLNTISTEIHIDNNKILDIDQEEINSVDIHIDNNQISNIDQEEKNNLNTNSPEINPVEIHMNIYNNQIFEISSNINQEEKIN